MSFDILCQTFTERQARIYVKIKTLLHHARTAYLFFLLSFPCTISFQECLLCKSYFSNRPFAPTKNDGRSLTESNNFAQQKRKTWQIATSYCFLS